MRTSATLAALLFLLAAMSACITYDAIPAAEIATRVRPGDRVLLETRAGEEMSLRVIAIDPADASIVGADARVPVADIVKLERRRVSWGRTGAAVGGGALILLGALALAILAVFSA